MLSINWNFASKSQNFIAMFHHYPGLTFNFWNFKIFPVLKVNSLCKIIFLIFFGKFPVFSLSGKSKNQIPCFPCAVATLFFFCRNTIDAPETRWQRGSNFLSFYMITFNYYLYRVLIFSTLIKCFFSQSRIHCIQKDRKKHQREATVTTYNRQE